MKTKVLVMILSAALCAVGPVYAQHECTARDDARGTEEDSALTQDAPVESTAPAAVSIDKRWYAGIGIGSQVFFGKNDHLMKFGDRIAPSAYLKLGTRFTNVVGLELNWLSSRFTGISSPSVPDRHFRTRDLYTTSNPDEQWYRQDGWFSNIYIGVTVDFTNWFGGVNPDRGSSVVLNAGGGLACGYGCDSDAISGSFNASLMYDWRFRSSRWSINATLRGALVGESFDGESCPDHTFHGFAGLDIGTCFRF